MKNVGGPLKLTEELRHLIFTAIKVGKQKAIAVKSTIPPTATDTFSTRLQYDMVNTEVENMVNANPHLQLTFSKKKAAFFEYITVHDHARNVDVLVLKLPQDKYIYPESRYRGDYATYNFDRLIADGFSMEELVPEDVNYQTSILFEGEVLPYSIIVGYDSFSDYIFEGALRPDQSDWIYKDNISDLTPLMMDNVIPFVVYKSDINADARPEIKPDAFKDILVKLKDTTKDS